MNAHLMIGTPCIGGHVSNLYALSVLNFQKACLNREDARLELVAHWGDSLTTRAKQGLVTQFLGHPSATHLLFINADVGFNPDQVFRLLNFDKSITAAAKPIQNIGRAPTSHADRHHFQTEPTNPQIIDGFVKSNFIGTELMLIKRTALQSMVEGYQNLRYRSEFGTPPEDPRYWSYALFNCMIDQTTNRFLSGDESFCKRWSDLGGEIWVDLGNTQKEIGSNIT